MYGPRMPRIRLAQVGSANLGPRSGKEAVRNNARSTQRSPASLAVRGVPTSAPASRGRGLKAEMFWAAHVFSVASWRLRRPSLAKPS
jgi:hypothetical protein